MPDTPPNRMLIDRRLLVAGGAALAGAAALYMTTRPAGNASVTPGTRLEALAKGELAALQVRKRPETLPALAFRSPDGNPLTLADFRGRHVLLNLWATWCAPCKKEMPALDRLQAELGGPAFEVVAVNIDTRNTERANEFLDDIGVKQLKRYADHSAKIFQDLKKAAKATGMPTTILIDRDGREVANLAGPAEWASPDAFAFIREAIKG